MECIIFLLFQGFRKRSVNCTDSPIRAQARKQNGITPLGRYSSQMSKILLWLEPGGVTFRPGFSAHAFAHQSTKDISRFREDPGPLLSLCLFHDAAHSLSRIHCCIKFRQFSQISYTTRHQNSRIFRKNAKNLLIQTSLMLKFYDSSRLLLTCVKYVRTVKEAVQRVSSKNDTLKILTQLSMESNTGVSRKSDLFISVDMGIHSKLGCSIRKKEILEKLQDNTAELHRLEELEMFTVGFRRVPS